jgi:hypothetical protein
MNTAAARLIALIRAWFVSEACNTSTKIHTAATRHATPNKTCAIKISSVMIVAGPNLAHPTSEATAKSPSS